MTTLEQELRALAPSVVWPEAPDVGAVVAERIAEPRRRPRWRPSPRLALALAVVVAGLVAAFAVPPARTAILDWLGLGSARIQLVEELPAVEPSVPLDLLGAPTTRAQMRERAGFSFAAPPQDEPPPDEVRVAPGLRVSYVWRDGGRVRALITQVPATLGEDALVQKLIPPGTTIAELRVDGDRAVWLEGGPHAVFLLTPDGTFREDRGWLAGNTLLVARDGVTIRIEGALDRDQAVELARAMHR